MTSGFWDFSLKTYAQPGVADALLTMQNTHGADVNLLLYCAWHAASGRGELFPERIAVLDSRVEAWRRVVIGALRNVREHIKSDAVFTQLPGSRQAREKVLEAELACEQVAQQLLESLTENKPVAISEERAVESFGASLGAYCDYLGLARDSRTPVLEALRVAFRNN
ncbi:MAG: TIGR02444 family protein [Gammaproteobacteria bacterium]|nr:TIGR02444 family protein [Gammaproteobacteria bacterium]